MDKAFANLFKDLRNSVKYSNGLTVLQICQALSKYELLLKLASFCWGGVILNLMPLLSPCILRDAWLKLLVMKKIP